MNIKWMFILVGLGMVWSSTLSDELSTQIVVFIVGVLLILLPLLTNKLFTPIYKKYLQPMLQGLYKVAVVPVLKLVKIVIVLGVIGFVLLFLWNKISTMIWNNNHQILGWVFAGYSYRWSSDYVENKGLNNELECVDYGDRWIKKQDSEEAIYTCSSGCKDAKDFPGMLVCKKICEYEKTGLVRCRD